MSLTFTQTISLIDNEVHTNDTSYPIADKVLDINVALDDAIDIAIKNCGTGQFDDTNHTNYPIITTDLVSGQRDVTYTQDQTANLVLDIYKVMIAGEDGVLFEIPQVDMQSEKLPTFYNGQNLTGTPSCYDRTGNGIIFDVIPNYDIEDGVKLFINREGSYFTVSDTTKKSGLDGRLHEYLVISPAYKYASRNSLDNKTDLEKRKLILEDKIKQVYSRKDRDVRKILTSKSTKINYR
jgi:hypothetical protein